jgi:5'-deoxynucleotidase YfbR-like HD superfamily hydrolase
MKQSELLKILEVAGRLKRTTRHCWTELDRKERVADHS